MVKLRLARSTCAVIVCDCLSTCRQEPTWEANVTRSRPTWIKHTHTHVWRQRKEVCKKLRFPFSPPVTNAHIQKPVRNNDSRLKPTNRHSGRMKLLPCIWLGEKVQGIKFTERCFCLYSVEDLKIEKMSLCFHQPG